MVKMGRIQPIMNGSKEMQLAYLHSYQERYVSRLRPFDGNIYLDIGGADEVGIWDTERKCFVRKNEAGEFVPE